MEAAGFVLYSGLFLPVELIAKETLKLRETLEHVFSDRTLTVVRWYPVPDHFRSHKTSPEVRCQTDCEVWIANSDKSLLPFAGPVSMVCPSPA